MSTYLTVIMIIISLCCFAQKACVKRQSSYDNQYYIYTTQGAKICLFFATAVLVVTAGCRYRVGTDYKAYISLYNTYVATPIRNLINMDEPIVPLIGNICGNIFETYKAMFFLVSLLTIGLVLCSIYHETTDFVFVTLLYIFVGCWHGSFNGIRQYLAVAIVFLGRHYIVEKKFWQYALVCFGAFLCHKSAIAFIVLYFARSKKIDLKRILVVAMVTVFLSRSYEFIFDFIGWINDSEFVMTEYASNSVSALRVAVGCAPALLALYYVYYKKLDVYGTFYAYMMIANAVIRLSTAGSAYLARLGAYTAIFVPVGLTYLTRLSDRKNRIFLRTVIVVLYFFYWFYEITNSATLYNFEWFFGK